MLRQQESSYEKASREAAGVDTDLFSKKILWLEDKWNKAPMSGTAPARLMCPMVLRYKQTVPINLSIIADNLDYFKDHYQKDCGDDLDQALEKACLCGSRKIAEFLLEQLNVSYTDEDRRYLFPYVCASNNNQWIEDIASKMAKANKEIPTLVFLFSENNKITKKIKLIFDEQDSPFHKRKKL